MFSTPSARRRRRLVVVALAGSMLASAGTGQAATQIETLDAATPVAAYDGTAMWSRLDAATGKYQLVQSVDGGMPTPVAVPQRDGAFDVDLGSNRADRTYAVYTRDGDIYRLNPQTGVEVKLTKLSSPELAERDPSIQGGRVAFLRRAGGSDQLRLGDTISGSKGTRLLLKSTTLRSIELGTRQVAYVDVKGNKQRVHLRNVNTGKDQVVYQAASGGASFSVVTKPSFPADSSGFLWARSRIGTAGSRIVKYTLRTGKLSYAQGSPRYAAVAWVGDELGALVSTSIDAGIGPEGVGTEGSCTDAGVEYCNIQYTGPLSFDLKP